jgi:hypothetical protein
MKNIIIVLQRSELNYLIKYDSLRISTDRVIDFSYEEFKTLSEKKKLYLLQNSLPIYEQDHEVLLIEYNTDLIRYDNAPSIQFKGISSIIPLTVTAEKLLSSKLNVDFKILEPLDSKIYKSFINDRNHTLRYEAGQQFCSIYEVAIPDKEFIIDFKTATLFQLNNCKPGIKDSTLAHLIDFNVTPSFIPEGNIEAVIKSACVGMKKLNKEVDQITKSTFYSFVTKEKSEINEKTLYEAINYIEKKTDLDEDEKKRFNKLKNTLSENEKYQNAFLLFSYFYFLKKQIEKNDYDISVAKDNILELKYYDSDSISKVLFMLGYTFSIQTISKSIQSFSKGALLKTQKSLDLKWIPKAIEQDIIRERTSEKIKFGFEKNEQKDDSNKNPRNYTLEDQKKLEIQLSVKNVSAKEMSNFESKIDNQKEPLQESGGLFSNELEYDIKRQFIEEQLCDFEDFKKSVGNGKFANTIIEALEIKKDINCKISKQTLISCLEKVGQYRILSGEISSNAKKALKIFNQKISISSEK